METLVDVRGGRLDLMIQAGFAVPAITLTFSDADGSVLDLTGYTVVVRASTRDDPPVSVAIDAAVTDAAAGTVTVGMVAAEVAKFGAVVTAARPVVRGDWVLALQAPAAEAAPSLYGQIYVAGGPS